MTEQAFERRVARLASWLADEGYSIAAVRRETAEVDGDEDLDRPRRFAVVEQLELPGHAERIVRTADTERSAESHIAALLERASESSWYPCAVLDLDTGEELHWSLSVRLARTVIDG